VIHRKAWSAPPIVPLPPWGRSTPCGGVIMLKLKLQSYQPFESWEFEGAAFITLWPSPDAAQIPRCLLLITF